MKLLFLRSQLVDVEVPLGNGADFGDVQLGFNLGLGNRLDTWMRNRGWCGGGGLWLRMAGSGARGWRRRLRSDAADGFGDFVFERAARPGLQGHGREAGKNFKSGGERRGSG